MIFSEDIMNDNIENGLDGSEETELEKKDKFRSDVYDLT